MTVSEKKILSFLLNKTKRDMKQQKNNSKNNKRIKTNKMADDEKSKILKA